MTIKFRHGFQLLRAFPVASGTIISVGDQVHEVSGKLQRLSGASDNLTFKGVAREAHHAADISTTILISLPNPLGVFEVELDASTTIGFGDELQWNAHQKAKKSTTDAVWVSVESKLSATKIHAIMQLVNNASFQMIGDGS